MNRREYEDRLKRINIWVDCDPGIDDAVALGLLASKKEDFNIIGISTVAGNQYVDKVTKNCLEIVDMIGLKDIPVIKGCHRPILKKQQVADYVHGESGIGNTILRGTDKTAEEGNFLKLIRDKIMSLPDGEKLILVPMAPLTNIALLFRVYPETIDKIHRIVLMGGAASGGNITPSAEFNIWADPDAAQVVYSSGLPIVMCGLDLTHQCGISKSNIKKLQESSVEAIHKLGDMLTYYNDSIAYKGKDMVCMHDSATLMYLLYPHLFSGIKCSVEVDCSEGINRGNTVCDLRTFSESEKNVLLLNEVDADEFERILIENINLLR